MSEEPRGIRALPPALLLGLAVWLVLIAVQMVFMMTIDDWFASLRFNLATGGMGFASEVLCMLGAFELARRLTGREARGVLVAAIGFAAAIAVDLAFNAMNFMDQPWDHAGMYEAMHYATFATWLAVAVGVAIACWREHRVLAVLAVAFSVIASPPPFLREALYGWVPDGTTGIALQMLPRVMPDVLLLLGFAAAARGVPIADRVVAASGLRGASKALWLRVIAAVSVALLTLMVVGARTSKSGIELLQLATMVGALVNFIALVLFGLGAIRAGRGYVAELGRWPLVVGGAASLWGAGVALGKLPWLYRMLYADAPFGREQLVGYVQGLSIAMPLVLTVGIAIVAVAIGGLATRTGNGDLRAQAQAKGAGFVTFAVVSVAITAWMVPKAQHAADASSFMILSLLAAGASLGATVMMARLCTLGAEELERDAGLPAATVVSRGD